MRDDEVFITSLLVQAAPQTFDQVCAALAQLPDTDLSLVEKDSGKIIILLEMTNIKHIEDWIAEANKLPGVYSVSMIYQHSENNTSLNEVIA